MIKIRAALIAALIAACFSTALSFQSYPAFHTHAISNNANKFETMLCSTEATAATSSGESWFSSSESDSSPSLSVTQLKAQILQLGAALDRGQSYNPTSGEYYSSNMEVAKQKILDLLSFATDKNVPERGDLESIQGEWELVFSTVKHGIFRSSPFFLAIQDSYSYAEEKEAFGEDKATLFFRLHELQTCSWGISKIGRVAQQIKAQPSSSTEPSYLYSEFDTSLLSLTVIPLLGWFKLLPTFGGTVITATKAEMADGGELKMIVDYTTFRPVEGLKGLGDWIWGIKVPVNFLWKLFPWNKGREPTCSVFVKYVDDDFRVVKDKDGDYFVYSRPVVSRPLDLMED